MCVTSCFVFGFDVGWVTGFTAFMIVISLYVFCWWFWLLALWFGVDRFVIY